VHESYQEFSDGTEMEKEQRKRGWEIKKRTRKEEHW
jgi:hypothetical protein